MSSVVSLQISKLLCARKGPADQLPTRWRVSTCSVISPVQGPHDIAFGIDLVAVCALHDQGAQQAVVSSVYLWRCTT
jgi:hypothetical protein